jgi:hypothetical protein
MSPARMPRRTALCQAHHAIPMPALDTTRFPLSMLAKTAFISMVLPFGRRQFMNPMAPCHGRNRGPHQHSCQQLSADQQGRSSAALRDTVSSGVIVEQHV